MSLAKLEMIEGIKIANDLFVRQIGKMQALCYKGRVIAFFDGKKATGCLAPTEAEDNEGRTWGIHTNGNIKKFVSYIALTGNDAEYVPYTDFRALVK